MKIIAFTGMPFSGKTEAVEIARKMDIEIIRMGDLVWEEVKKRGLKISDKNVGFIANEMRDKFGKDIWAVKTIEKIKEKTNLKSLLIDGIRSFEEVERFKKSLGNNFILIAINSTDYLRHKRALNRGREDDSKLVTEIKERDIREIKWGIKNTIELSDIIVSNNGTKKDLKNKIIEILNNLLKNDKLIN
jgi:dephospho-CoA kinase